VTALVVDAGVLAAALAHERTFGVNARAVLQGRTWHIPAHGPVESLSVLRKWARDGTTKATIADTAALRLGALRRLTVHDQAGLTARTWDLRHNLSTYDAAYVALAEQLGCEIVTVDGRLSNAPGPTCPIVVVPRD
jgi:predicted nucleic acid-binding protein